MRETKDLEFKLDISNSFLKTVSAYANYGDGKIIFGVDDNGKTVGIDDPINTCLAIENKINDSIDPVPEYNLKINRDNTITLSVREGLDKPYFYHSKVYMRNDSATIEVDRLRLNKLILEGKNIGFEELTYKGQDLSFDYLKTELEQRLNISSFSLDILKTLELYTDKYGYNNAAGLFADTNAFPGIDSLRIGENINIMQDREQYVSISILKQYDEIISKFRKYYAYDKIEGTERRRYELIPEAAFREVIANALVHRDWDIDANINVAMYADKIEVTSPGGLPKGMTEEAYLNGGISIPRNPIVANIFLRFNLLERFGTGIRRINECYRDSELKPIFKVFQNMIQVVLPVLNNTSNLSEDEALIVKLLKNSTMTSMQLAKETGFGRTKTIELLNKLKDKGLIKVNGRGRSTHYSL